MHLIVFLSFLASNGDGPLLSGAEELGKPWECPYAEAEGLTTEQCKEGIARELDRLFADFDIRFVIVQPKPTTAYKIVSLTNDTPTSWSLSSDRFAGITSATSCDGTKPSASVVFDCPSEALCAKHIMHEIGHQLGLVHVADMGDVMFWNDIGLARFARASLPTLRDDPNSCRKRQNSYAIMMKRLGPRFTPVVIARRKHHRR